MLIGSGVTEENVTGLLPRVDGVIVASSLKFEGVWWNAVDPARVARFMTRVRAAATGPTLPLPVSGRSQIEV